MARTTVATIVIIVIFGFELIILAGSFYGLLLSVRVATSILGARGIQSSANSTFFLGPLFAADLSHLLGRAFFPTSHHLEGGARLKSTVKLTFFLRFFWGAFPGEISPPTGLYGDQGC